MKKIFLVAVFCSLLSNFLIAQSVGINNNSPHGSAVLDITSKNKGLLIPRMLMSERNLIASPATGLMIFQTDNTAGYYFYNGAGWVQLGSGGGSNYWSLSGGNIFNNNNTGNVGIGTNNPTAKLSIQTPINSTGWTHIGGENSIVVTEAIGGVSASIGTTSNHAFRIHTNGSGKISVYPQGEVVIGPNATGPVGKLTVQAPGYGLTHTYGTATIGTWIGSFQGIYRAMIGTKSNHPLSFFTNDGGEQMTLSTNGGVGIGTTSPSGKLQIDHPGPSAHLILNYPRPNEYSRLLFSNTGAGRYWGIAGRAGTGNVGDDRLSFYNTATGFESMVMAGNGYVSIPGQLGIGTFNPAYKFSVNGTIRSKEIVVESLWADYVFNENYKLPSLDEVEKFIQQNKHLPNIPSAKEVEENGLHLGDTQKKIMEKIEELTLYVIEQNKMIIHLQEQVKDMTKK